MVSKVVEVADDEFEVTVAVSATKNNKRFCKIEATYWGPEKVLTTVERVVVGGLLKEGQPQ